MSRSGKPYFPFRTGKVRRIWLRLFTARSCGRKSSLSRRRREWERPLPQCSLPSRRWEKDWGTRSSISQQGPLPVLWQSRRSALWPDRGFRFKTVTLTAREKICFCEEADCNPEACPYAEGHYDRVNDAVYEMITQGFEISRSAVEAAAKKYRVCPFEMSLDISTWVDAGDL